MPRIKQDFVFNIRDLEAFVSLDGGIGKRRPETTETSLPKHEDKQVQGKQGSDQGSDTEKSLAEELRREKKRRQRADGELARLREVQRQHGGISAAEQYQALPEPDDSVGRGLIFRSLLSQFKKGKMLDLGAGPGHYSLAAARLGWEVTAVDARTMRTPDAEAEENSSRAELIRSVNWVESDIREFPIQKGKYDLICIFGLLHHLELKDHIELLSRCSNTLTLMNVRIAPEITATEGAYEGTYHIEPGKTREERDQLAAVSWGNESSFLHTEESLLRLARDCGYLSAMTLRPPHTLNYTFYMCLPSSQ